MTLKELSQLYYLTREVERDRARLADLRAKATSPKIPGYSSLPRNSTAESQLEKYVAATSELEALIAEKCCAVLMNVNGWSTILPAYRIV